MSSQRGAMANAVRCIGLRTALHSRHHSCTPIALPHFNGDATAVKLSFFHTGIRTPASFPNNSNTTNPSCQPDSECEIQHS